MGACLSKDKTQEQPAQQQKPTTSQAQPTQQNKATTTTQPKPDPNKIASEALPNRVEDQYDVGEEIGRGAFSIVKVATHRQTGKKWAVKFIDKKFVDKQDLMLLAREIDIMKRVRHDNVLSLQEVYETEDTIALVMELVTGGELFYKIVEKGNYSEKDAANIVSQMIKGVAYLHGQGIAHRDLKPENLLLW